MTLGVGKESDGAGSKLNIETYKVPSQLLKFKRVSSFLIPWTFGLERHLCQGGVSIFDREMKLP